MRDCAVGAAGLKILPSGAGNGHLGKGNLYPALRVRIERDNLSHSARKSGHAGAQQNAPGKKHCRTAGNPLRKERAAA